MNNQEKSPVFDAVRRYVEKEVIPFHVPGHRQGMGLPELQKYVGARVMQMDLNGMHDLDYINHPSGVILEAQELLASAFGADSAYFLVNGTTSGVQAMIMCACQPGDKIILPRNAHRSTIAGIILSGALPVYIQPEINRDLGIAMGISPESLERTIRQHPDARAVFLINPTYYGYTSDLKALVALAHRYHLAVLVDEAHGAHMYFHPDLPDTAMEAGADISAASMHKTGGSLTQSSVLLYNSRLLSADRLQQNLNLCYTSSASYLLLCSLDLARKQLATRGYELLVKVLQITRQARRQINHIPGFYAFGPELAGTPGTFGFDRTKLGINVNGLKLSGCQLEIILRQRYNIQVELSDPDNILAIVSLGHSWEDLQALLDALQDIAGKTEAGTARKCPLLSQNPEMVIAPREAFYRPSRQIKITESAGQIAAEMIMAYPPGIPIICMGERITPDIIDYIRCLREEQCELQGMADPAREYIKVVG